MCVGKAYVGVGGNAEVWSQAEWENGGMMQSEGQIWGEGVGFVFGHPEFVAVIGSRTS